MFMRRAPTIFSFLLHQVRRPRTKYTIYVALTRKSTACYRMIEQMFDFFFGKKTRKFLMFHSQIGIFSLFGKKALYYGL